MFSQFFAGEVFSSILGQMLTPFLTHQSKSQLGASKDAKRSFLEIKRSRTTGQVERLTGKDATRSFLEIEQGQRTRPHLTFPPLLQCPLSHCPHSWCLTNWSHCQVFDRTFALLLCKHSQYLHTPHCSYFWYLHTPSVCMFFVSYSFSRPPVPCEAISTFCLGGSVSSLANLQYHFVVIKILYSFLLFFHCCGFICICLCNVYTPSLYFASYCLSALGAVV